MKSSAIHQRGTVRTVQLALLSAIIFVLALTPLGFIPLGPINATTIHIPVILGAIWLGPAAGGFLGGVFGLSSLLINTVRPGPSSFVFSPFYAASIGMGGAKNALYSLLICFLPRILIGVAAGWLYRGLSSLCQKSRARQTFASGLCGVVGSFVNTLLVMGGIWLLFGPVYAQQVKNVPYSALGGIIMGVTGLNGTLEALVAGVITALISAPVAAVLSRQRR